MNNLKNIEAKYEELEFTYIAEKADEVELTKKFYGTWLVEDSYDENVNNAGIRVWIGLTKKGELLYHWRHKNSGIGGYTEYDDFKALQDDNVGANLLAAVAGELGIKYAELLDI